MTENSKFEIDPELANDPNYLAYQKEIENGRFKDLPQDVWVLFLNGVLVDTRATQDEIFQLSDELPEDGDRYIDQPNMPEVVYHVPSPHYVSDIPTIEEGEKWFGDPDHEPPENIFFGPGIINE